MEVELKLMLISIMLSGTNWSSLVGVKDFSIRWGLTVINNEKKKLRNFKTDSFFFYRNIINYENFSSAKNGRIKRNFDKNSHQSLFSFCLTSIYVNNKVTQIAISGFSQ